jgi:hypothetical protein
MISKRKKAMPARKAGFLKKGFALGSVGTSPESVAIVETAQALYVEKFDLERNTRQLTRCKWRRQDKPFLMIVVAPVHHEELRTWCAGIAGRASSHDSSGEIVWDRGASDFATRRTGRCSVADGAVRSVKIDKTGRHDQVDQLVAEEAKEVRSAPRTPRIYTPGVCILLAVKVAPKG